MMTGLELTDMETCYKMFSREVVDAIKQDLISLDFSIEPEITAKIKKFRVTEVPIGYKGRSVLEGKKIHWIDGLKTILDILRFNIREIDGSRVIRFIISGVLGLGVNVGVLYLFTRMFGLWYLASATLSFIISTSVSFLLQKFWTFGNSTLNKVNREFAVYLMIGLLNLCANDIILFVLVHFGEIHFVVGQLVTSAIIAVWSYFIYRRLFKAKNSFHTTS
jgi:putative flippase GtrA